MKSTSLLTFALVGLGDAALTSCGSLPVRQAKTSAGDLVYFPSTGSNYPLISFGHGAGAGGAVTGVAYSGLLHCFASKGFVVVATPKCDVCGWVGEAKVQLEAIEHVRAQAGTVWGAMVDFDNIGIAGHSQGGGATVCNSDIALAHGIKAAAPMHPAPGIGCPGRNPQVPTFFSTGSADHTCPEAFSKPYFATSPARSIMAVIKGADHMEPTTADIAHGSIGGRLGPYVARFFECHLKGDQTACDDTYGSGPDSLCHGGPALTECTIKGGEMTVAEEEAEATSNTTSTSLRGGMQR
jgi:hypothetical protein